MHAVINQPTVRSSRRDVPGSQLHVILYRQAGICNWVSWTHDLDKATYDQLHALMTATGAEVTVIDTHATLSFGSAAEAAAAIVRLNQDLVPAARAMRLPHLQLAAAPSNDEGFGHTPGDEPDQLAATA